ncbi:MAG: bifunctional oligoribonuclease/PAP phosphatase NrnA [Deltaproteobacteria bacterium]|nr:MAG: bifunctional oligoribonuclease/PAP phosphatase NrnA [Deltaproteobacteria bacterium]
MASKPESITHKEHSLRVVERVNLRAEESASKKWEEFHKALVRHRGERILVVLIGYPDPDCIASGLAHKFLAEQFDIDTTLLCFHEVSHQENRAMVKQLGIDLQLYDDRFDLHRFSAVAFVDTQKIDNPISDKLAGKALLSLVDHHRRAGEVPAEFVDIREDVASTAAIYTEYLRARFPKGLNPREIDQIRLATALMHGMRSDTMAWLEVSRLEFEAASYLWPCVDQSLLKKISAQSLKPAVMDMIQKALENKQVVDNFILTDVGFVRGEHRDGIPQAAEFLLRREGTETVLAFGIVDGKNIDGSIRTRSDSINPDAFLKKAFGLNEERQTYYGGGNIRDKGGFQIPLGLLAQSPDRELLYRMACELVREKFLQAIGRKE